MIEAILNNFMLLNCRPNSENYKRYNNKNIYTCILSLGSDEPIFYELNIDKNNILLKQIIKQYLFIKYSAWHDLIYDFYKFCYKNKPTHKNSINYTLDKLTDISNLPEYITDFFNDIKKELNKCDNDKYKIEKVLIIVYDKELFINSLNIYLKNSIDAIFELSDDVIVDY